MLWFGDERSGYRGWRGVRTGRAEADGAAVVWAECGEIAGRDVGDVAPELIGVVGGEKRGGGGGIFLPELALQLLHALLHVGAEAVVTGSGRVGHESVAVVPPRLLKGREGRHSERMLRRSVGTVTECGRLALTLVHGLGG
jgi:hypothetical protein